jgi:aerobic-type carbon monoxide dehydrogenase small subunit (CoxS/CutS family)
MTTILINGMQRNIDADPQMPLLWAIRDILGLTGTKAAASGHVVRARFTWMARQFAPA